MRRILCSTGALIGRPNGRDHRLLEGFAKKLNCDGFEFMIYNTWYPELDKVIDDVSAMQLDIPVVHCEKGIGEYFTAGSFEEGKKFFKLNCQSASKLGADMLVLHLWNGIPSDSHIERNISIFGELCDIANSMGLLLTAENVVCNVGDPIEHLRSLLPCGFFTFDTKMAAFHGQLMELYEPKNLSILKNVRHFHINDYGGGYMDWKNLRTLHIGDGNVDLSGFFDNIPEDYSGDFTIESTGFDQSGSVDTERLNADISAVKELSKKISKKI